MVSLRNLLSFRRVSDGKSGTPLIMDSHWLTRPATIRALWIVFGCVLALTVIAEIFVVHEAHFGIDGTFAFHAWYGFLACAALIGAAKLLGLVLKRPDSYYQERE